jgi:hypothetical protein
MAGSMRIAQTDLSVHFWYKVARVRRGHQQQQYYNGYFPRRKHVNAMGSTMRFTTGW